MLKRSLLVLLGFFSLQATQAQLLKKLGKHSCLPSGIEPDRHLWKRLGLPQIT